MVSVNSRAATTMGGRAGSQTRDSAGEHRLRRPEHLVVERDASTGLRLKFYSQKADVDFWTAMWKQGGVVSYEREVRGHLPHQLRDTFRRWVQPGSRTLEAGCGPGRFTVALHALGYRAEGLDWSAETIAELQQRFPEIPWHPGDVRQIDRADGTFDAVYLPGVCEHFEEGPEAILIEMRRVLRPGGIAVVSTPCFNPWLQRHVERRSGSVESRSGEFYQYAFTPDGMARLLGRIGFDVLQVKPYGALETFMRYAGWRIRPGWRRGLAVAMDYLPVVRNWGSTCIWVARKR